MNRTSRIATISALLLLASACSLPIKFIDSQDQISNAVAQTIEAGEALTQAVATLPPQPTYTPYPTLPPSPTQPIPLPPPLQPTRLPQSCDQAKFVSETVADGTRLDGGESFTKSWRLKNVGTCNWSPNYKLVFFSGDRMSGPKTQSLGKTVKPGESVDVAIKLVAPEKSGTYTGYWKLQSDDGGNFYQVYTQIRVGTLFAVTSVKLSALPAGFSGACPTTIEVKAAISANGEGKVTYKWKRSDGVTSDLKSMTFSKKGTKTVSFDWELDSSDTYSVEFYVSKPNNQWFGTLEIPVECLAP